TRTGVLISTSAAYAVEQVELLAAQPESTGGDVLLQVCRIAGTGDGEYMITLVQCPRQADLGRRRTVRLRHRGDLRLSRLVGGSGCRTARRGDGEERYEGHPAFAAQGHQIVVLPVGQAVQVLYAHHRCDVQRLGKLAGRDVGQPELPDQPGFAELGQGAEVLSHRA